MSVSNSLKRLLQVREILEELRKRDLAAAATELARLEQAHASAGERVTLGRILVFSALDANDLCDRLAGQVEIESGEVREALLKKRAQDLTSLVEQIRADVIEKRVERRQVETIVEVAATQVAIELERKTQQALDEWFLIQQGGGVPNDLPADEPDRKVRRSDRFSLRQL